MPPPVARRAVATAARAVARPAARSAAPVSSGYRGAAGLQKMQEEERNAAARKEAAQMNSMMPFRFYCEAGGPSKEIVVVDYSMEEVFFRFEHNLKDKRSGKWSIFCACLQENANCPACREAERPSYFAMFLTVIDLTPYVNKDGIEVPWSKKLLVVKTAQQKKITRIAERNGGSLRGVVLLMTRDGDKDAQIGNDIEFVEVMSEDDLLTYETTYEYTDGKGDKKVKEIIGHEPFEYDELFPLPTEQQIRAIVGGQPEPGSREADSAVRRPLSSRRAPPADEFPEDRPAPTRRPARTIAAEDAPDAGAPEDEYEEPAAPARTARPVARRAPPVEVPEEELVDPEPEYEAPRRAAPTQRPAARSAAQPTRSAPAPRRAAQPDPEEEPQRGAATPSLADRRRALRR